ncbi:2OG-Fe(II) oxygenase [Myxococcota bacterium]|nr:2OG-Fe(II) oxygenase [Myxococcota bacterium]
MTWRTLEAEPLSRGSLEALCRAEIPAVHVDALLDDAECDAVMRALPGGGFERYARRPAFQTFERIGIAQGGYGSSKRDEYFEAAVAARAERDAIVRASGVDPLARAMDRLRTDGGADVSIAREADGREYFAGIIRRINTGVDLHADCCRRTDPRWQIHGNVAQLSLNVYLTDFTGGACVVHDRLREEADDVTVPRGSYVYDRALVRGASAARLQPKKGELLMINSRCFHEVEPATSDRVTFAAFVGLLPDGRFVVWA